MLHRFRKQAKGFTLIELLIVVAIIGILAAIAIPNLVSAQKKAKISRALADTRQIVSQSQLYNNDKNTYPTALTDLMGTGTGKYMTTVYDPFGATSTTNYGVGWGTPVYALSVGPDGTGVVTAAATAVSSSGCSGVVGFQSDLGAITVTGC